MADRRVCEDRHVVRKVTYTGKQKEKQGYAFGRLSSIVEEKLGYPRSQIQHRTQVSENLAPEVKLKWFRLGTLDVMVPMPVRALGGVPSEHPSGDNNEDRKCVEEQ